jgi:hypothetical protein
MRLYVDIIVDVDPWNPPAHDKYKFSKIKNITKSLRKHAYNLHPTRWPTFAHTYIIIAHPTSTTLHKELHVLMQERATHLKQITISSLPFWLSVKLFPKACVS